MGSSRSARSCRSPRRPITLMSPGVLIRPSEALSIEILSLKSDPSGDLGRHLVTQRFQDVEFLPLRQPRTGQFGALEVAVDPPVLTEEELPVHLLEIEGKIERASNPRILKLVASRVEGEGPHDPPVALGEFAEDEPLLLDRRNIVRHGPVLGTVLGAPVRVVGLEGFQCDRRVTKILVANFVEVIAPDINVQTVGPIVFHPPVNHHTAGHELLDAVGAIAERRLERGCAYVALLARRVASFPPVLGQYSELSEDHWHFPIVGGTENESDLALAALLNSHDVAVKGADEGVVFLVGLEGIDHVLDRNRLAVMVAGGGAQAKGRGRKVRGMTDRFRDKPVMGRRFVE